MTRTSMWMGMALAGLFAVSVAGTAFGQNAAGGAAPGAQAGGGGGGGRPGGRFDPAQWQQRMMDHFKESLGASDEEWKLLQPKVEKVTSLQRQLRAGGMFGGGRRGGNPDAAPAPTNDVEAKAQALRTALDNKETKNDELAQKMTALRTAREKARTDLAKAQTELRELLTPRQEAQMVLQGILD